MAAQPACQHPKENRRLRVKHLLSATTVMRKTLDEVDGGWTEGPFTLAQVSVRFPHGFWPTRRFGVGQKGDTCPCDDR